MVHSCEVHFSAAWCAYSLFLELSKARAFEATSVRRGGRNEGGDLLHRRSRQKNFAHVQRAMRGIFDVKVLFPRLVCSASKFQTSCLWNLTRASLAKATTRVRYVFRFRGIADACIGKFNEQKSLLEVFGIRW